jgi:hypothetical protein
MIPPIDAATWAGLGVVATLIAALIAHRAGWLQIGIMRQSHALDVAKSIPCINCFVGIAEWNSDAKTWYPYLILTVKIQNEGILPAHCLKGQWKLLTNDLEENRVFPIQRDIIGHCEGYTKSYKIEDSCNWARESVRIDVEVEFSYSVSSKEEEKQYHAKYSFDPQSVDMIKRDNFN